MSALNQNCDSVERSRELLHHVTLIYGEMEAGYARLQRELASFSPEALAQKIAALDRLMDEAREVDRQLAEELRRSDGLDDSLQPLLATRMGRLENLFRINRDLVGRAENGKALLRHELSTMRTNRNALQGYRPPGGGSPGLIRTSF